MTLHTLIPQRRGYLFKALLLSVGLLALTGAYADKDDQYLEFDDTMLEEELVYPDWFKLSLGDLNDDIKQAAAAGKSDYVGQRPPQRAAAAIVTAIVILQLQPQP